MHSRIEILVDIYTPSQTILVIICGSFQYLHNLKKQVKLEEKFKAFETSDRLALELHKQNSVPVKIHILLKILDLHKSSVF